MRRKEGLLFLMMALLSFCTYPSASPLVHSQENEKEKVAGVDLIDNKYDQRNGTSIAHQNKYSHGMIGGGGNGGGQPSGSSGENGGSHSPYVQGGGGVTPLYAAGAGNNHHSNHHGRGNSNKSTTGLTTLVLTISACFLLCINNW